MSFADPQSVTVNGSAKSLPRTGSGNTTGSFQTNDGLHKLEVSHQVGKARTRHMIRLTESKITTDPLSSAQNIKVSTSTYLVADVPNTGYTVAEMKYVVDALVAYLSASSGAKVTQLLGNEN